LTEAKLSSKYQITIPKRVIQELGLESGDKLRLEVQDNRIVLVPTSKVSRPTEALYGSIKKKIDAVRAIRDFRKTGGRA
jgi:AbrB family looped-hinge helix DNA binding protein